MKEVTRTICSIFISLFAGSSLHAQPVVLKAAKFKHYIDTFNANDNELYKQQFDNAAAWNFLQTNIPYFECPDKSLETTYYFRWWTYRKHLKKTEFGTVITEFLPAVSWAGKENTINCATGHHIYEGRWLHDTSFINSYVRFWFFGGGNARSYSTWLADAVLQYAKVKGNYKLATQLLPNLVTNYEAWEKSNGSKNGLFWSIDDRDGMEMSVSGNGLRPTLNSYMFADAKAISTVANLAKKPALAYTFAQKAAAIKRAVQTFLWDTEAQFFKVIPLAEKDSVVKKDFATYGNKNVRELLGFTPWYVNMPDSSYAVAWQQLMKPQGFYASHGLTTTEQRSPRFAVSYSGHECQWNGPSWPFATSITLTAMANLLKGQRQPYVSKQDYLHLLRMYSDAQQRITDEGKTVNWIDENLNPYTGDWISRTRLQTWKDSTWDDSKGGVERGKDYNHSTFCDLIISGLVGIEPQVADSIVIHPLVSDTWKYFCLDNVLYHGKIITVLYDKTGTKYGHGKGFKVLVDGKVKALANKPQKITLAI